MGPSVGSYALRRMSQPGRQHAGMTSSAACACRTTERGRSCPTDELRPATRTCESNCATATLYVCRRRPSAVGSGHCGRAAGLADGRISSSTPAASSPMWPALARPRGHRRSGHIGLQTGSNERVRERVCSPRRADGDKYKPLDLARLLSEVLRDVRRNDRGCPPPLRRHSGHARCGQPSTPDQGRLRRAHVPRTAPPSSPNAPTPNCPPAARLQRDARQGETTGRQGALRSHF